MAESITAGTIFLSLTAGIIPPLLWLWFWIREDSKNPEPRRLILLTFIAGMFSVIPTFYIQQFIGKYTTTEYAFMVFWPLTEELAKFTVAYVIAIRSKEYDEPIDGLIYLITAALGFAAAENFLFLVKPDFSALSMLTANMRFVGATLLHLLSSSTIGIFMAFAFYKNKITKNINIFLGLFTATTLHSLFNLFIIKDGGKNILNVFTVLWSLAVILVLLFEKVKRIDQTKNNL